MKKKCFAIYFVFIISPFFSSAQEIQISKKEVVEKLLSNNIELKIGQQTTLSAKADFQQSNSFLLPQIELSYAALTATNPLMVFGSKLNQEKITSGDFTPDAFNNPNRINHFASIVEVRQPIFNMDAIYQRNVSKYAYQISQLQNSRRKDYLVMEAEKAYMDLQLSHQALKVTKEAVKTAKAQQEVAINLTKEGIFQKVDLLEISIALSEAEKQHSMAKIQLQNTSDYLSYLIQSKQHGTYFPTDSLMKNPILIQSTSIELPEERSDLKALELAEKASNNNLKANKAAFIPNINAFGSYQLYDNKAFQADASGYLVGARLSWNLFEGNQRAAKINKSKAEFEKTKLNYENYKAQSQIELNRVIRSVQESEERIETSKLMLEQAKESLRIRSNRFKEGMEKPSDISAAQSSYNRIQLIYYQSIYEYNLALSELQFLTKEN